VTHNLLEAPLVVRFVASAGELSVANKPLTWGFANVTAATPCRFDSTERRYVIFFLPR